MWLTKKSYQLMVELKQAAEQKAKFFEQLNYQLTRENRRLIERLLAKGNVPMVESPENIIQQVVNGVAQDYKEESNGDIFEDDDMGEPIIRDSNDQKRQQQESDQMEMQP